VTYFFRNIDITKQLLRLTTHPTSGADQTWFTDALCRGMNWLGLLDISFETDEPSNPRKMWFDAGNPPTGAPGVLKVYDDNLDDWVPLTRTNLYLYDSRLARARIWKTSELGTALRPPDAEVMLGDEWHNDVGAQWLAHYIQIAPKVHVWITKTGGEIAISALTQITRETMAANTVRTTSAVAHPVGTFYGQELIETDTGRWYKWTPAPDRWQDFSE
jgi:hypothetical protein